MPSNQLLSLLWENTSERNRKLLGKEKSNFGTDECTKGQGQTHGPLSVYYYHIMKGITKAQLWWFSLFPGEHSTG